MKTGVFYLKSLNTEAFEIASLLTVKCVQTTYWMKILSVVNTVMNTSFMRFCKLEFNFQLKCSKIKHDIEFWVETSDMTINAKCGFLFVRSSTELLVVHLCRFDESAACSALMDIKTVTGIRYPSNTQVNNQWLITFWAITAV